ncbi:hypothetical protein [Streptomyces sp. NPDC052042]|uniref:hypothetical protein n=1 Tax=Streptomyces sp. NPDC052042 TaxID=3365683 RepID=UPI0037D50228
MSRSMHMSGPARMLLRTTVATLSTLSFVVGEAPPTAHAADDVERARPSAPVPVRVAEPAPPLLPVAYADGPVSTAPHATAIGEAPRSGAPNGPVTVDTIAVTDTDVERTNVGLTGVEFTGVDLGVPDGTGADHACLSHAGLGLTAAGLLAVAWAVAGGSLRTVRRPDRG